VSKCVQNRTMGKTKVVRNKGNKLLNKNINQQLPKQFSIHQPGGDYFLTEYFMGT